MYNEECDKHQKLANYIQLEKTKIEEKYHISGGFSSNCFTKLSQYNKEHQHHKRIQGYVRINLCYSV